MKRLKQWLVTFVLSGILLLPTVASAEQTNFGKEAVGQGQLYWSIDFDRTSFTTQASAAQGSIYVWYRYIDQQGLPHTFEHTQMVPCALNANPRQRPPTYDCAIPSIRQIVKSSGVADFAEIERFHSDGELCVSGLLGRDGIRTSSGRIIDSSKVSQVTDSQYQVDVNRGVVRLVANQLESYAHTTLLSGHFALKVETQEFLLTDAYTLYLAFGTEGPAFETLRIEDPAALIHPGVANPEAVNAPATVCSPHS